MAEKSEAPAMGTGPWTAEENHQFERGCVLHGWGNWKLVAGCVPSRTKIQVKSHAQKFSKHKCKLVQEHNKMRSAKKSISASSVAAAKSTISPKKRTGPQGKKLSKVVAKTKSERSSRASDIKIKAAAKKVLDAPPTTKETATKDTGSAAPLAPGTVEAPRTPQSRNELIGGIIAFPATAKEELNAASPAKAAEYTGSKDSISAPSTPTKAAIASPAECLSDILSTMGMVLTPSNSNKDAKKVTPYEEELYFPSLRGDVLGSKQDEPKYGDDPIDLASSREMLDKIRWDKKAYDEIHAKLVAIPDFNNSSEYVIRGDGSTRTALDTPALMRARIKLQLEKHQAQAWWRDDAKMSPGEDASCAERLIALIVAMYNMSNWTLTLPGDADDFTPCKFDEEDDILHVGQMVADIWERVDRSLSRGAYSWLGPDGLERYGAIYKIVGIVVHSSRRFVSGLP